MAKHGDIARVRRFLDDAACCDDSAEPAAIVVQPRIAHGKSNGAANSSFGGTEANVSSSSPFRSRFAFLDETKLRLFNVNDDRLVGWQYRCAADHDGMMVSYYLELA